MGLVQRFFPVTTTGNTGTTSTPGRNQGHRETHGVRNDGTRVAGSQKLQEKPPKKSEQTIEGNGAAFEKRKSDSALLSKSQSYRRYLLRPIRSVIRRHSWKEQHLRRQSRDDELHSQAKCASVDPYADIGTVKKALINGSVIHEEDVIGAAAVVATARRQNHRRHRSSPVPTISPVARMPSLTMNGITSRKESATSEYGSRKGSAASARPSTTSTRKNAAGVGLGLSSAQPLSLQQQNDLLTSDDPMAMHLLMETAMMDSQQFRALSFEEAEELKRELPTLSSRIDATQRKLAIESKVRDAATSLDKLDLATSNHGSPYQQDSEGSPRKDSMSSGKTPRSASEVAALSRKCENLSHELRQLEHRQQEIQRRLLEHTAGVLQMTHKGYLDMVKPMPTNGYTSRKSTIDIGHFDDESFYSDLDSILEPDQSSTAVDSKIFEEQKLSIQNTERKLWDLNQQLRDAIHEASEGRTNIAAPPGLVSPKQNTPAEALLQRQVTYLLQGMQTMQQTQSQTINHYREATQRDEQRLRDINARMQAIGIQPSSSKSSARLVDSPTSEKGSRTQLDYLDTISQSFGQNLLEAQKGQESWNKTARELWNPMSHGQPFSLSAFTAKVSGMTSRISDLQNQKNILQRQIEQQRSVNSKTDQENLTRANAETEAARAEMEKVRQSSRVAEDELLRVRKEMDAVRKELDPRSTSAQGTGGLTKQIVDLKKELSTYRSKAQENDAVQQRMQALQRELGETITEYELMTKASIEFERERETLEVTIDQLKEKCEGMEGRLAEQRIAQMGKPAKSNTSHSDQQSSRHQQVGSSNHEKGSTSTSVLRTEFKKMMRDMRSESLRAIRHEQEERRKLEVQLRELKKGHGLVKSSLGQSVSAE